MFMLAKIFYCVCLDSNNTDQARKNSTQCFFSLSKKCIFMGDTNIDTLTKTSVSNEYINFNTIRRIQSRLIFEATRITENSQSCIDHIFTNISTFCSSGSLAVEIADHLPVFSILYNPKFSPFPDYLEFRDFRGFERGNFKLDLR